MPNRVNNHTSVAAIIHSIRLNSEQNLSLSNLRSICKPQVVEGLNDLATLEKLAKIISDGVLKEYQSQLLTINSLDEWQCWFRLVLTHPTLKAYSAKNYQANMQSVMAILNSACAFINNLTARQAKEWRSDRVLMDGVLHLLRQYLPHCSIAQFSNQLVQVLKSFEDKSNPLYNDTIRHKVENFIRHHSQIFNGQQSIICLKLLAEWYLDDNQLSTRQLSLLKWLYQHSQTVDWQRIAKENQHKFKQSLVQSYYYLKVHKGLAELTKNGCIQSWEKQLLETKDTISKPENTCLDYTQDKLGQTIYRQALCCGYPVDGLLIIEGQPCVIEIDGPHHNLDKQHKIDRKRDYLLSLYGYWVVRVDLTKMEWVRQEDITRHCVASHLYFLPNYLKNLASLQTLLAQREIGSFIRSVTAPCKPFKECHTWLDLSLVAKKPINELELLASEQPKTGSDKILSLAHLPVSAFANIETLLSTIASHGMSYRQEDSQGNTLLHYAVEYQQYDTVCALLEHNVCDVSCVNNQGETAWAIAQRHQNIRLMDRLTKALTYKIADDILIKNNKNLTQLLELQPDFNMTVYSEINILHLAVLAANEQACKQLLPYYDKDTLTACDAKGLTLLHKASLASSDEIVTYLLKNTSIDIDAIDQIGGSALHYAFYRDNLKIIDELLICGADVTLLIAHNQSVSDIACKYASKNTQEYLWSNLDSRLFEAIKAEQHNLSKIDKLIKAGASPYVCVEYTDIPNASLLTYAMLENAFESFQHLFQQYSIDPNHDNGSGLTVLHHACRLPEVSEDYVRLLLTDPDTDINIQTADNYATPLHLALECDQIGKAQCFLACKDLDLTRVNKDNQTVLHLAMAFGYENLAYQMLNQLITQPELLKQVTEHKDAACMTPLYAVLYSGNLEFLKHIYQYFHVDYNQALSTEDQVYPIHLVAQSGYIDMLDYLVRDLGVDVKVQDDKGNSALHYTSFTNEKDMARHLVMHYHLDPTMTNKKGDTLFHFAAFHGRIGIMDACLDLETAKSILKPNNQGFTVLDIAQQNNHAELFDSLQNYVNTLLERAIQVGRSLDYIDWIIKGGGQLDSEVTLYDDQLGFMIHWAAYHGQTAIVQHFIDHYNQPWNDCPYRGKEPLYYALSKGHLNTVECLLSYDTSDIKPTLKAKKDTFLYAAIDSGNQQVVVSLLNRLLPIVKETQDNPQTRKGNKKHRRKYKKSKLTLDYSNFQRYAAQQLGEESSIALMLSDFAHGKVSEVSDLKNYESVSFSSAQLESKFDPINQNLCSSPISFVNCYSHDPHNTVQSSPAQNPGSRIKSNSV